LIRVWRNSGKPVSNKPVTVTLRSNGLAKRSPRADNTMSKKRNTVDENSGRDAVEVTKRFSIDIKAA